MVGPLPTGEYGAALPRHCLLPQREALRTCRSGFRIAAVAFIVLDFVHYAKLPNDNSGERKRCVNVTVLMFWWFLVTLNDLAVFRRQNVWDILSQTDIDF